MKRDGRILTFCVESCWLTLQAVGAVVVVAKLDGVTEAVFTPLLAVMALVICALSLLGAGGLVCHFFCQDN